MHQKMNHCKDNICVYLGNIEMYVYVFVNSSVRDLDTYYED